MKPDEFTLCSHCSGSGEGQFEGSTCYFCKGKGEVIVEKEEDINDDPQIDYDNPIENYLPKEWIGN